MPKYDQEKLKGNTPVDSYEISKQLSREERLTVAANKIDAYAAPAKEATSIQIDPDVAAVTKSLDNVNNSVSSFIKLQDAFKEENKIKAKSDQMQGKRDPSTDNILNMGTGYTETWSLLHGEAEMSKAQLAAQETLKKNNFFIHDKEPQKRIAETIQSFYGAVGLDDKDPYMMAGAAHPYQGLKEYATRGYQEEYWKKAKETHVNDVGTEADVVMSRYLSEKKEPTAFEFRELLGGIRQSIDPNLIPPNEQGQVIVDQILNKTYQKMKNLTTEGYFEDATDLKNNILAALKVPDKSGLNWYEIRDENGKRVIGGLIDAYENEFVRHIDREEQKLDAENKKVWQDNEKGYLNDMLRETNRTKLQNYMITLNDAHRNGELDNDAAANLTNTLKHLLNVDANVIEDPNKVYAFMANVYAGKAKISEVGKALDAGIINRTTAEKALGMIERIQAKQDALNAEGRRDDMLSWQTQYSQAHTLLYGRAKEKGVGSADWGMVEDYYNTLVHDKGISPSEAKTQALQTFFSTDKPFNSSYQTAAQAKQAYLAAKQSYNNKKMSKAEFDKVTKDVLPWELASKHYVDTTPPTPTIKKK